MRIIVPILVRAVALAAVWALFSLFLPGRGDNQEGADIGAGVLGFALLFAVAAGWGVFDGRRRAYAQVALIWVPVAVLVGLLVPVLVSLAEPGFSQRVQVLLSDLLGVGPFIAALVGGSALTGGIVGRGLRSSRRDNQGGIENV